MSMMSQLIDRLRGYADSRKGYESQLTKEAANVIEDLTEKVHQLNMERGIGILHNGWIPMNEMEPVMEQDYLVSDTDGDVDLVSYRNGNFVGREYDELLAWAPLPAAYVSDDEV